NAVVSNYKVKMLEKLTQNNQTTLRRLLAVLLIVTLGWTTVACGNLSESQSPGNSTAKTANLSPQLSNGKYPVQQATYDDGYGVYTLMLLNTPPGSPPAFRTDKLQMARLTDEQINQGEKTYLEIEGDRAVMYLTEDFKIEYVHNVAETKTNPQTGQQETVIVRQESNFWTPFAGALAGQALGSLLFRPQYYVPPMYQPGGIITGYGGYGNSYNRAVENYQTRYKSPPAAVKNRQTFRATGNLRKTPSATTKIRRNQPYNTTKSSGSGYGTSKLRSSGKSSSPRMRSSGSFGSGSRRPSRSFGSGRRR
ncbi:MAG: hypothetical protein ACKO2V_08345, partial [Snowella sp.]